MNTEKDLSTEPPVLGEYNGFEIYPMPFFAVLVVDAPEALAQWYQRVLGFGAMFQGPIVHLRRRKYQDLLLSPTSSQAELTTGGPALTFQTEGDLELLAERFAKEPPTGHAACVGPVLTPWNTRELRVTDPVGHRLVFIERPQQPDPKVHAHWQEMFDKQRRAPRRSVTDEAHDHLNDDQDDH